MKERSTKKRWFFISQQRMCKERWNTVSSPFLCHFSSSSCFSCFTPNSFICPQVRAWPCVLHACRCYCQVTSVVSDSVRPNRWQPSRLPRPWDSPGKNTGVGCHFLLQYVKVKSQSEVAQSCPTPSDPMDCSLPGSSIHGIFQARVLEVGCHLT